MYTQTRSQILGALCKTVSTGGGGVGWKPLHLSGLFRGLLCFQLVFTTFTLHDLTDFYIERVTTPHYNKVSFMFSYSLAKFKIETKIKSYLRARGPPGVSGALRSLHNLRKGRICSVYTYTSNKWHKKSQIHIIEKCIQNICNYSIYYIK